MLRSTKSSLYWSILVAFGLGIGVALSVVVYARPQTGVAEFSIIELAPRNVTTDVLKVDSVDVLNRVGQEEQSLQLTELSNSLGIDKKSSIIEVKDRSVLSKLENMIIGDNVTLIGSNNGLYTFHVVQTRYSQHADPSYLLQVYPQSVIVFGKVSILSNKYWIVVAR